MTVTLLIFFGIPLLLMLAATGVFARGMRNTGGEPVAVPVRRPRY